MQHLPKITVFLHHWRSFQKPFQRRKGVFCSFCCSQGFRENKVVCYATVSWEGALRDDTTNSCEAEDLGLCALNDITLSFLSFILLHSYPRCLSPNYWSNPVRVVCSPKLKSWAGCTNSLVISVLNMAGMKRRQCTVCWKDFRHRCS